MKTINFVSALFIALFSFSFANAQTTESGNQFNNTPNDGIYQKVAIKEKMPLPRPHVNESEVMWEKRIWREIDTRTLRNKHFTYDKQPLINILLDGVQAGDITAYGTMDDEFKTVLTQAEAASLGGTWDTIETWNPETLEPEITVVFNELDPTDVKKFRVKEVTFFSNKTSRMETRILGIAPVKDVFDDNGNFLFSTPMCWFYYPETRHTLARTESFNTHNDAQRMSWDDVFEARLFESTITKQSNVYDKRIQDDFVGIDALLEADKIQNEIFNFEQSVWEY